LLWRQSSSTPLRFPIAMPAEIRTLPVPGSRVLQPCHLIEPCQSLGRVLRRYARSITEGQPASHHAKPGRCSGPPKLRLSTMDDNSIACQKILSPDVGKLPLLSDGVIIRRRKIPKLHHRPVPLPEQLAPLTQLIPIPGLNVHCAPDNVDPSFLEPPRISHPVRIAQKQRRPAGQDDLVSPFEGTLPPFQAGRRPVIRAPLTDPAAVDGTWPRHDMPKKAAPAAPGNSLAAAHAAARAGKNAQHQRTRGATLAADMSTWDHH